MLLIMLLAPWALAADTRSLIVDEADILYPSEEQELEAMARALGDSFSLDVVILTVNSLMGKDAQHFADDFYDGNGYGVGASGDGILFLLAMEERQWYISTCGDTVYAITDYAVEQLGETAVWYFSDGSYFSGFYAYLEELAEYMEAYAAGAPMDGYADYSGDYYHGDREEVVYYEESSGPNVMLSFGIGLVAATVAILVMRSTMNTKKSQRAAYVYLKKGSFRLRTHQDLFLYSNVSKVRKQQNTSSGRSGGGSSVHRSSGGRRHGGGGGRF